MKVISSILALLWTVSAGWANVAEPSPDQLTRLLAGEVVPHAVESGKAGGSARMQILADAPAEAIWNVIISCEKAFAFVDGLEVCEVLEDSGDRALVHQVVKRGWPIPTQDFIFKSLREPHTEMSFQLVEGNLKVMEGSWRFDEMAEGTLVDYQIRVQPAVAAPKFLVRRNIEKGMPDLLACIRGLAGGSLSEDQAREDLQRCPGEAEAGQAR
jgi:ribosome-associated toxin RatA of RatAB toxin-antitoxin module